MTSKTEVATKANNATTAVAMFDDKLPAHINQGAGRGSEGVGTEDMIIPRLGLCQSLSPQRKKTNSEYIEGIEEGDLFNTLTGELYGKSIVIVPVLFKKEYLVWVKRDGGGSSGNGFRGAYPTELMAAQAKAELDDGDKCEIVETASNFCLIIKPDGTTEEIVVSMAKSQMKASRKWNSLIRMSGGDRFSRGYELSGIEESSDKGDYFGFGIRQLGFTPEDIFAKSVALYDDIKTGTKVADSSGAKVKTTDEVEDEF